MKVKLGALLMTYNWIICSNFSLDDSVNCSTILNSYMFLFSNEDLINGVAKNIKLSFCFPGPVQPVKLLCY